MGIEIVKIYLKMKQIILALVVITFSITSFSQNNPRPTKSRFWNSKFSTFSIKPGDVLVYTMDNGGKQAEMIVRVKKFGPTINFDYDMAGNRSNVNLQTVAVNNAVKYNGAITNAKSDFKNESAVWISKKSYRELASEGSTKMDFGNGPVTFTRGNTGTLKINYKGKEKIVTLFNITSEEAGNYSFGVLTDENNPLILTLNTTGKLTLKEVR